MVTTSTRAPGAETAPSTPTAQVVAAGTSPDEAMATLPGVYGGKHWQSTSTDGPYSYRYTSVGDASLSLRRSQLRGFLRGEVHVGGDYVVHWLTAGSVVLDTLVDPRPLSLMRPDVSPDGADFVFEATDYDARLVHLDRALVHDVASEQLGTTVRAVHTGSTAAPRPDALARWREAMVGATAVLTARDLEPLAWHEATRAAAAAFLGLFPPLAEQERPALLLPRNARIRLAVEFIHAAVAEPLTVGRIADAAGLSIRSTQEGFQRVLGVTPMQYVQRLRLERVRADLAEADPSSANVSTFARRWGFVHLGRFAGAYRQQFGEFPSNTLRR